MDDAYRVQPTLPVGGKSKLKFVNNIHIRPDLSADLICEEKEEDEEEEKGLNQMDLGTPFVAALPRFDCCCLLQVFLVDTTINGLGIAR